MIFNILVFVLILAILIIVHEFGHYLAAKKFKMKVEEFGFGFPPRIFAWKKGETIWSINAVFLGGFVKIAGEDGETKNLEEKSTLSQEKLKKKIVFWKREKIDNLIDGRTVTEAVFTKEEILPQNLSSKNGYFSEKPIWQRGIVLLAGVLMNFILGWLLLSIVFSLGTESAVLITNVSKDSPAEMVGLKAGDKILNFQDVESFVNFINQNRGKEISFFVESKGEKREVKIIPRLEAPLNQGAIGVSLIMGGVKKTPWYQSIWESLKASLGIFSFIFVMLFKLIISLFGKESLISYLSGPIGIYEATTQAAEMGFVYLLNLVALISLNLAALNIFPFPALDGGRIVFLIAEKIKGSPISLKIQQILNGVGFALMLLLLIIVSIKDILKLI